jgi:hypothetical protein
MSTGALGPKPASLRERQCSRPGCSDGAGATLSYSHGRRSAWLTDLTHERDAHSYDLCSRHADRLSVPQGWTLDDRRADTIARIPERLAG